jgi:hypothetical protein
MNFAKRQPKHKGKDAADKSLSPDDSSTSPTQKVRAWLLSRFPRPRSKSASTLEDEKDSNDGKRGFIGGAALTRLHGGAGGDKTSNTRSLDKGKSKELTENPASSMREVAMAGRTNPPPKGDEPGESATITTTTKKTTTMVITPSTPPHRPTSQISQVSQASIPASELSHHHQQQQQQQRRSVSSMSSSGGSGVSSGSSSSNDKFVMARSEPETGGGSTLTPPRGSGGLALGGRASPFRESRFSEIL